MKIITTTPRLLLREFLPTDAEKMFELNTDSEVLKYTGDKPFNSVMDAAHFLNSYSEYRENGFGRWAVVLKETNEFIGWCGLKKNEDDEIDIGFRFFRNQWSKGYASEAAIAALNIGFNHFLLSEIIARANTDNKASLRVLEKLRMKSYKIGSAEGLGKTMYYRIKKSDFKS